MSKLYANIQCAASWAKKEESAEVWANLHRLADEFWSMSGINGEDTHDAALDAAIKNGINPRLIDWYKFVK